MISVPQAFFDSPQIDVVLRQGQNCIICKEAQDVNRDNERYVAAHALTAVHAGQLVVRSPDGDERLVSSGEVVLLPRGIYMITDIIPDSTPFQATVFFFDEDLLQGFLSSVSHPDPGTIGDSHLSVFPFTADCQSFLEGLLHLRQAYKNQEVARLKLLELLHLLTSSVDGKQFLYALVAICHRKKQSIKAFMEQNFEKPLKIEDYAYLTGRSVSTFHRDFKRQFGVGPKNWLIERRLLRARRQLLETPDMTVTQLAYEAGYDNISYFIRAFQRQFDISPKQLQIRVRDNIIL